MNKDTKVDVYELKYTDKFNKDMKHYIQKKKYTKLPDDIEEIVEKLKSGEFCGDRLDSIQAQVCESISDNSVHKTRAKNSNTKVGESNGYRVIYYVECEDKLIFLVTVYSKKDDNRIPTDNEIVDLIKTHCLKEKTS